MNYKSIIAKLKNKPHGTYDARGNRKELIFDMNHVIYIVHKNGSIYRSDPKLRKTFRIYPSKSLTRK